jgi:hypothetical protein
MNEDIFLSHGRMNITVDNDLVILDIEGPCNTEFFKSMSEQLKRIRPQINLNNYTCLVILHNEALATQDAMSYFTNYLKTIQVRAVAINLANAHNPEITKAICRKSYSQAGVQHDFFFDNTNAIAWLRACMA